MSASKHLTRSDERKCHLNRNDEPAGRLSMSARLHAPGRRIGQEEGESRIAQHNAERL